jgi:hypothetical protein
MCQKTHPATSSSQWVIQAMLLNAAQEHILLSKNQM